VTRWRLCGSLMTRNMNSELVTILLPVMKGGKESYGDYGFRFCSLLSSGSLAHIAISTVTNGHKCYISKEMGLKTRLQDR